MLIVIVLLICIINRATSECFLDNSFLNMSGDPGVGVWPDDEYCYAIRSFNIDERIVEIFSLRPAFDVVDTNDECKALCDTSHWCFSSSFDVFHDRFQCFLTTSHAMLGFDAHRELASKNFHYSIDDGTFLNLDNKLWKPSDIGGVGTNEGEFIIPSRIKSTDRCYVSKSDDDALSVGNVMENGMPFKSDNGIGSWYWFFSLNTRSFENVGYSLFNGGFPIKEMGRYAMNQNVVPSITYLEQNVYQFGYQTIRQCQLGVAGVANVVPPMFDTHTGFFHIKMGGKYLDCVATEDDNDDTACTWVETPTLLWTAVPYQIYDNARSVVGEYSYSLEAYDINGNLETPVGVLDRSHCDSTTDNDHAQIRLLVNGQKSGATHCGVTGWQFIRGGIFGGRAGSFLCWSLEQLADNPLARAACLTQFSDNQIKAEVCTVEEGKTDFCDDYNHINTEKLEIVMADITIKSYPLKLMRNSTHMFYCSKTLVTADNIDCVDFTFRSISTIGLCNWVPVSDTDYQLFKLEHNGQRINDVRTRQGYTFVGDVSGIKSTISVWERNNGGTWDKLGYLMEEAVTGRVLMSQQSSGEHVDGFIITDTVLSRRFKPVNSNGIIGPLKDEDVVDDVVVNINPSREINTTTDGTTYHWITGNQCPPGEYIHQIRCLDLDKCIDIQVACVKERTICKIDTASPPVYMEITPTRQSCDGNNVVLTGINATHYRCGTLSTGTVTNNVTFPSYEFVGILSQHKQNSGELLNLPDDPKKLIGTQYNGNPIQGMVLPERHLFTFGDQCNVSPDTFDKITRSRIAKSLFISDSGESSLVAHCDGPNEYIIAITCDTAVSTKGVDCDRGLKFVCGAAKGCVLDPVPVQDVEGICPVGSVMTGIQCKGTNEQDACSDVTFTCKHVSSDPSFDPDNNSDDGTDSKKERNAVTIILIALGVAVPVLVLSAIACLFCFPDTIDNGGVHDYSPVPVSVSSSAYPHLRQRHGYRF